MKSQFKDFDFNYRNEHTEGLITGLLLGATIGACVAILLAPKSGKALRGKIKDLAGSQTDKLTRSWEQAKDSAGKAAGDAINAVDSAAGDAESKVKDLAGKAEDKIEDGVETVVDRFQKRY
ncbi:YtxH domain-containing protein [Dyadobacter sp. CY345]|uniref:YtxH domain-containing protein n=1 Tax=Dyadobacter sp. CY345 TaxID=2909335 RepID=UPI001F20DE02|nr:YtxH domain-containing protein [Dyadobacter sp. CY345]MCF2447604.1 YtxH domain-containing protein [Dyadobacter sp. CY345]